MNTEATSGAGPVDQRVVPLVERLQGEADQARSEGADDIAALLDEAAAALSYYRAGLQQEAPEYVPKVVRITRQVRGDGPFRMTRATTGEHEVECNRWGAVSVRAGDGQMLGLRPSEFDVVAWRRNTA